MRAGAGVQTSVFIVLAALGIVLYQQSISETLKSEEEAGDGKE